MESAKLTHAAEGTAAAGAAGGHGSRIPGFYKLGLQARQHELLKRAGLCAEDLQLLDGGCLAVTQADHMVENVVGTYALPLGLGLNFQVNGRDYLVPMCVEEPSVVAAASNAARMIRAGGGFIAEADPSLMIAQVQLIEVPDTTAACAAILAAKASLIDRCNEVQPGLVRRGGGTRDLEVRVLQESSATARGMLVVHLLTDCRDAMGANLVNTVAEAVAEPLATLARGQFGLRILSNLADHRCVRVRCKVPPHMLVTEGFSGEEVRDGIVLASRFAELDPYRAATHNKGIMNGIDPVVIATGNDWRGIEAGAHAFAAREGTYRPLAIWRVGEDGMLHGFLEVPMAIGTVGGTLRVHPGARLALRILDITHAGELGMVIGAAGLASNLAALRALSAEGIQRGHMSLHARSVALAAGATGAQVDVVAAELSRLSDVRKERAEQILASLRDCGSPS
jgi:hydroxymethylglutaryl-CoA reductase